MTILPDSPAVQIQSAHLRVMLSSLDELRVVAGLDAHQIALMADLKRVLNVPTTIRSTLTEDGKITQVQR